MMTKEQELKTLEQIKKILAGTDADSYVRIAFQGCVQAAAENIENDWACSPLERAITAESRVEKLEAANNELRNKIKEMDKSHEQFATAVKDEHEKLMNDYQKVIGYSNEVEDRLAAATEQAEDMDMQLTEMKAKYEADMKAKDTEIMMLKAKLYDLLIK